jgi:4'-phosphopantetheinyl transferase
VEFVRPDIDWEGIGRDVFEKGELDELNAQPPKSRVNTFYELWTRKEAMLKCSGVGLGGEGAGIATQDEKGLSRYLNISVRNIDPGPDYVGAVAVAGDDECKLDTITFLNWAPGLLLQ